MYSVVMMMALASGSNTPMFHDHCFGRRAPGCRCIGGCRRQRCGCYGPGPGCPGHGAPSWGPGCPGHGAPSSWGPGCPGHGAPSWGPGCPGHGAPSGIRGTGCCGYARPQCDCSNHRRGGICGRRRGRCNQCCECCGHWGYSPCSASDWPHGAVGGFADDLRGTPTGMAPALLVVTLPAGTKLLVENAETESTSATRRFESPPLEPGKDFYYVLKAELVEGGQVLTITRQVLIRAGQETHVFLDFSERADASSLVDSP
jgi:uncharacterized protein (TIGR03000 family)